MDHSIQLLALDFDGVIVDSVGECLVSGQNAFNAYNKQGDRIYDLSEFSPAEIKKLRFLRNFIRSGEDYVFLHMILAEEKTIQTQSEYDVFTEKNKSLKTRFYELFHQERSSFYRLHRNAWIQLNPLYSGMGKFIANYENQIALHIISTKDPIFIHKILSFYEIATKIHIFHSQNSVSKKDIVRRLLSDYSINAEQFYFVDDHPDTLIDVARSGVNCFLAAWGYNMQSQQVKVIDSGLPLISLSYFTNKFGGNW